MKLAMIATAALVAGVAVAARQQSPLPPTFRSNVEAITLDVRVVDRNGQFVDGLTADDLRVFEDGREQAITAFERVNIPIHGDGRAFAGNTAGADVASNDGPGSDAAEGRLYVLLLDDLHTPAGRAGDVRAQARDFLEHDFEESDRAMVLTASGRLRVAQEFTNNRQRLLGAIDRFESDDGAGALPNCQATSSDPAQCETADDRAALRSLSAVSSWLAGVVGQRKAILFFGEGLSADQVSKVLGPDPTAPLTPQGDETSGDPTLTPGGVRLSRRVTLPDGAYRAILPSLMEAQASAARANVTVYPVDPRRAVEKLFSQVVADTSAYYLLGYVPTNDRHDGTFRKIEVRANPPGVRVQARTGYTAKNDAAPTKRAVPTDRPVALSELMATPIQVSGLTMSVSAPAFVGRGQKTSVEVVIDVAGRDVLAASESSGGKGSLALFVAVADPEGRVQASERGSLEMNLSATTREEVARHGLRVLSRLDVAPGRYLLRVAGVDGAGNSKGSVQLDLDVPDFSKSPIAMSGLAIAASSDSERPTTGSDKVWRERFDAPPTAARVFKDTDDLLISGEIYQNDPRVGAIEATTTVRSASGEEVFRRQVTLADGTVGTPSTFRHQSTVHLQDLDPGEYLLTVEAAPADSRAAAVSRAIPFTIR
jgi:VWFA-related protein